MISKRAILLFGFVILASFDTAVSQQCSTSAFTFNKSTGEFVMPGGVTSVASANACSCLQQQWDAITQQIQAQHQACLEANQGQPTQPSGTSPGSPCSIKGCQGLHDALFTTMAPKEKEQMASCNDALAKYQAQVQAEQAAQQQQEAQEAAAAQAAAHQRTQQLAAYKQQVAAQLKVKQDAAQKQATAIQQLQQRQQNTTTAVDKSIQDLGNTIESVLSKDGPNSSPMPAPGSLQALGVDPGNSSPVSSDSLASAVDASASSDPSSAQVLKGVGQIAAGCIGIAIVCAAEVPTGGLATTAAIFGVQSGATSIATGVTNVITGLSGQPQVGEDAQVALEANKNLAGQLVTIATGDLQSGKNAANIADAAVTLTQLPDTAIAGQPILTVLNANQSTTSLEDGASALKAVFNPSPSPSPSPSTSPSPSPPPSAPPSNILLGSVTDQISTTQSATSVSGGGAKPLSTMGVNVQYENLDNPTIPSVITYGTPQQPSPLFMWSPDYSNQSVKYSQNQPNTPSEMDFPQAFDTSSKPQFTRPAPVSNPSSAADCQSLAAAWSDLQKQTVQNHASCMANFSAGSGAGRPGADGSGPLCSFQACQESHNSMLRAVAEGNAAVLQCQQSLP